jgi:dUTP pyrophosphatase
MTFQVCRLVPDAKLPVRGTDGSAGWDLSAINNALVPAGGRALVDTGLAIRVPADCYGRVAPRSGLAVKYGIDVGAGVIDSDYTGPVKVLLFNHGDADFVVNAGDRIAQFILVKIDTSTFDVVEALDDTERGAAGFGSTGNA